MVCSVSGDIFWWWLPLVLVLEVLDDVIGYQCHCCLTAQYVGLAAAAVGGMCWRLDWNWHVVCHVDSGFIQ